VCWSEALSQTAKRRNTLRRQAQVAGWTPNGCCVHRSARSVVTWADPPPFGKGHETSKQTDDPFQFVTQRAAELEVLLDGLAQLAHCTASLVGQGRASERSPWISTFA